jgi:hypothetical protein
VPVLGLVSVVIEPTVLRSVEQALCLCDEAANEETAAEMEDVVTPSQRPNSFADPPSSSSQRSHQFANPLMASASSKPPNRMRENDPGTGNQDDAPLPTTTTTLPTRREQYVAPLQEQEDDDDMHLLVD